MDTKIAITIEGLTCDGKEPVIQWQGEHTQHQETLWQETTVEFDYDLEQGEHYIQFEFINKTNQDTTADEDLAVVIKDITINGISDPKIMMATTYRPRYPEPWLSQQDTTPDSVLQGHQYLGWNGIWRLEYTVPVFTWIHEAKGLGWRY